MNKQGMGTLGKGGEISTWRQGTVDVLGERQIVLCNRESEELCKGQITLSSLDVQGQEDNETAPKNTDSLININLERRL